MANSKSAAKQAALSIERRLRNRATKSQMRTASRRVLVAAAAGDASGASTALTAAYARLDRAAAKGIIKKNTAARHKSRLARRVTALTPQA